MSNFDEYQKYMRYKYGYQAFSIVLVLTLLNFFMSLFYDFQWGETGELETMVIVLIAAMYSLIMYIYKGAYFTKKQNPQLNAVIFFILGLLNISNSLSPYSPIIVDGKITSNIIMPLNGAMFVFISAAYLLKLFVEKRQDKEDFDEE